MARFSRDTTSLTAPAPLKFSSEAAAVQLLLTNPSDTYLPALAKQWSHLKEERNQQIKMLLTEQWTGTKKIEKKLRTRTLPDYNEYKHATWLPNAEQNKPVGKTADSFQDKFVRMLKTSNQTNCEKERDKLLLKHKVIKHRTAKHAYPRVAPKRCVMSKLEEGEVYLSPSHHLNCSDCLKGGACIYNFPLDALRSGVTCKSHVYFTLLNDILPLHFARVVLLEAIEKLTSRYINNVTFDNFYIWCEKLIILLTLCKRLSLQNIHIKISRIHHVAASAVLKLIEEFEVTNIISSLTISSNQSVITSIRLDCNIYNPYHFNFAKYRNLQRLSLDTCDYITLRLLKYCHLRELSIVDFDKRFCNMFKHMSDEKSLSSERPSGDCCDFDIKGSNLSNSLRCLRLQECDIHLCSHFIRSFPNLTDLVTDLYHFKLDVSKLDIKTLYNPLHKMNLLALSEFQSVNLESWLVHSLFHLEVGIHEENFFDNSYLELLSRPLPEFPRLKEITLICDQTLTRGVTQPSNFDKFMMFEKIFTFFEKSLQMVSTIRLRNFYISNETFNKLSALQMTTELIIEYCDIQVERDPCRTYFPSLTNLAITIVPTEDLTKCLFESGNIERLTIMLSPSVASNDILPWLKSSTALGHFRTLTQLSFDIGLLCDSVIPLMRAMPNLRKCRIGMFGARFFIQNPSYIAHFRKFIDLIPSYIQVHAVNHIDMIRCMHCGYYNSLRHISDVVNERQRNQINMD